MMSGRDDLTPTTSFPKLIGVGLRNWTAGAGAGFTVSVAALLVTVPAELLTTTRNVEPLSAVVVVAVVERKGTRLDTSHLYISYSYPSGTVTAATTANVAVCPAVTVWFAGCVVIVGATAAAFTVNVAALLDRKSVV